VFKGLFLPLFVCCFLLLGGIPSKDFILRVRSRSLGCKRMDSGAEYAVAEQPKPAFKVAANQVAGHRFEDGRVGSLVDDSGRFYKPLQDGA
jgi:hypothetical protein